MFDFDLQMRFVRSATNAFFECGQASMAAAVAWQEQIERDGAATTPSLSPHSSGVSGPPGMEFWTSIWMPWLTTRPPVPAVPNFWRNSTPAVVLPGWGLASMPVANTWAAFGWPMAMAPATNPFAAAWPWRALPWTFYQSPLIAMMMSSGVPYSVAAPAARASTSAMDAADAAQEQWKLAFSAYGSAGGHASSQIRQH